MLRRAGICEIDRLSEIFCHADLPKTLPGLSGNPGCRKRLKLLVHSFHNAAGECLVRRDQDPAGVHIVL